MRVALPVLAAVLVAAGCTQATVDKIDYRTFKIEGPGIPGGATGPNRRMAARVCPNGYRVLNQIDRRNTPDGYSYENGNIYTDWTIRCL